MVKAGETAEEVNACAGGTGEGVAASTTGCAEPIVSGRMCSRCHGHLSEHTCSDCEDSAIGRSAVLKLIMGCTFVFGFFLCADHLFRFLPSFPIVYSGLQVLALLGTYELGWDYSPTGKDRSARDIVLHKLAIINFNPTYAFLDCSFGWGWEEMWWLKTSLPLIVVGAHRFFHYVPEALRKLRILPVKKLLSFIPPSHPQATSLRLMRMLFVPLMKNSIEVWRCVEYGDGAYLSSAPEIDCATGPLMVKRITSVFVLLFYVCGVPTLYGAILLYGQHKQLFSNSAFQAKFGFIYMGFEPEWYFWAVKNFAYMGLHAINSTALITSSALGQGSFALMLISVDMLLLFYSRPFLEDWKDFLACAYRLLAFMLVVIGVLLDCHVIASKEDADIVCVGESTLNFGFWLIMACAFIMIASGVAYDVCLPACCLSTCLACLACLTCLPVFMHACVHGCRYKQTYACMYVRMDVGMYVRMHACMHVSMHVRMLACM